MSLVLTLGLQARLSDEDRAATYNRDILVPSIARLVTALDAFEQQQKADLVLITNDAKDNATLGLSADKYARLLGEIRSAKADVELTAPAFIVTEAARANDLYGTESACMSRLIRGEAGGTFADERSNRRNALEDLQRTRDELTADSRENLATATAAPVLDALSATPGPTATPPPC